MCLSHGRQSPECKLTAVYDPKSLIVHRWVCTCTNNLLIDSVEQRPGCSALKAILSMTLSLSLCITGFRLSFKTKKKEEPTMVGTQAYHFIIITDRRETASMKRIKFMELNASLQEESRNLKKRIVAHESSQPITNFVSL